MTVERRDWSRRAFVRVAAASGAAALVPLAWPRGGWARQPQPELIRLGLVVPSTPAGAATSRGAELGAAEAAQLAGLLGSRFELATRAADGARDARAAAAALFEQDDVTAVAGGLDEASADAIGAEADAHGRLFLNVGAPDDSLRGARCRRHAFHVQASAAMYADALAAWLAGEQGLTRWTFIDGGASDDAAYARARAALLAQNGESVARLAVSDSASAAAALSAIARSSPQVTWVLLRGEARADFARRYRDAGLAPTLAFGLPSDVPIWAIPAESRLGLWPVLWHPRLFRYGAEQVTDRFQDRFAEPPDSVAWAAWMAAKILAEGALRARSVDGSALAAYLEGRRAQFDGHKGRSLTFRPWDHQLRQPVYLVRARPSGAAPRETFEHVAELPLGEPGPDTSSPEFLDRLGDGPEPSACRFPDA